MSDLNRTKYLRDLRSKIVEHFNSDELSHLAFDLGIQWDELRGSVRSNKAQSLISRLAREGRLEELADLLHKERPKIAWPNVPLPEQQKEDELATIPDDERDKILEEYLAKMNQFAMQSALFRKSSHNIASANMLTKTYLPRLDKKRIEAVIHFLVEAKFNFKYFDFGHVDLSASFHNRLK